MRLAVLSFVALSACTMEPTARGAITAFNGDSVTIRSGWDASPAMIGKPLQPTPGIVAQAQEVCKGARFASANLTPDSNWTADYLFICPS